MTLIFDPFAKREEKAEEKGPYEQFLGHFRYVFENSGAPPQVDWGERAISQANKQVEATR